MTVQALLAPFVGPIGQAALDFPLAASLLALPFALWHYRRHGRLHPFRAFLGYGAAFYLLAAVYLVLLPLPDLPARGGAPEAWETAYGALRHPVLNPLAFIGDVLHAPTATKAVRAIFQALFNALLLLPLGFLLVYGLKRRPWQAGLLGLAFSLLMETCQLTGNFWIYPGPYRLFDTGDLLLNSLGCLLGAGLASGLVRKGRLPRLESLSGPQGTGVGPFRRAVGLGVDLLAFLVLALPAVAVVDYLGLRLMRSHALLASSLAAVVLILLPAINRGRGLGHLLTLSRIESTGGGGIEAWRILLRQATLWLLPILGYLGLGLLPRTRGTVLAILLVFLCWLGMVTLQGVTSRAAANRRGFVDRLWGTEVRNTWQETI